MMWFFFCYSNKYVVFIYEAHPAGEVLCVFKLTVRFFYIERGKKNDKRHITTRFLIFTHKRNEKSHT